jgi:hypothetical protein
MSSDETVYWVMLTEPRTTRQARMFAQSALLGSSGTLNEVLRVCINKVPGKAADNGQGLSSGARVGGVMAFVVSLSLCKDSSSQKHNRTRLNKTEPTF